MFKTISAAALAIVIGFASTFVQAEDHPAQALVENSIVLMLDILENKKAEIESDPEYLQTQIDELIVPNLDFETMTKLAVGKFWKQADADQRTELVDEFQTLLLNTYTGALSLYSSGGIEEGWRIYDIEVNSISLVTSYRSAFANEIDKGGIAGLIETIKKRNNK